MTKKELKQQQATFHAFIKSQQKPEIEANITFMEGEEERVVPVKIKQKLSLEEQINFVHRVVGFCVNEEVGMIYPSNLELGFSLALVEYFTDIKERIKEEDVIGFLSCFDIEQFLYASVHGTGEYTALREMCKTELEWEQKQYLNAQGVNGMFVKLNALIDKIDSSMDAMGGYMDRDKVEELLGAVGTIAKSPEVVAEKVLDIERARVRAQKEAEETVHVIDFERVLKESGDE